MADRSPRARESGAILVVVLWLVATMSLIAATLASTVRSSLGLAGMETDRLRSEALLEGSLDVAAARLIASGDNAWQIADGRPWRAMMAGGQVEIRTRDAAGLVDINRADPGFLQAVIARASGSAETGQMLAQQIVERRGQPDSTGQVAAEAAAPAFASTAELYAIEGADPRVIAGLLPYASLYSRDGRIDFATAPEVVLASVPGMTPGDLQGLIAARAQNSIDGAATKDIAGRYEQFLSHEAGIVFIVDAELVGGARLIAGIRLNATIVLDKTGESPFHVMSLSW